MVEVEMNASHLYVSQMINERGEPATSYKWTSSVWENTSWISRRQKELHIILEASMEHTPI